MLLHYLSSDLTSESLFDCDFEDTETCPFDETTNDIFDWRLRTVIMHFLQFQSEHIYIFLIYHFVLSNVFTLHVLMSATISTKQKKVVRFIFTSSCPGSVVFSFYSGFLLTLFVFVDVQWYLTHIVLCFLLCLSIRGLLFQ